MLGHGLFLFLLLLSPTNIKEGVVKYMCLNRGPVDVIEMLTQVEKSGQMKELNENYKHFRKFLILNIQSMDNSKEILQSLSLEIIELLLYIPNY